MIFEGCGFVKFSHREMAEAAIRALNGTYVMRVRECFLPSFLFFYFFFIVMEFFIFCFHVTLKYFFPLSVCLGL